MIITLSATKEKNMNFNITTEDLLSRLDQQK
jgi:hypothetical protein